jgi:hypothetical protein
MVNTDQDYEVSRLRNDAQSVVKALRKHALASKLVQVQGRTPAEAEMFAQKAQELAT